ncbi:uncharacterized protein SCDLUD_004370 [Saccharomycodes ludwigii]|uniref:uncharacterized protein n=1 Tax=Saccharomycodes ludwigii TaxID=36035 RepID=UPI001E8A9D3F|nr:hypothetical protein SCDLUD_004370 [Saccharomycodes ludwigii]KAH3900052.1 hypothetical protein SCDLUD_004370 [Saccharomycodes ludwigii]
MTSFIQVTHHNFIHWLQRECLQRQPATYYHITTTTNSNTKGSITEVSTRIQNITKQLLLKYHINLNDFSEKSIILTLWLFFLLIVSYHMINKAIKLDKQLCHMKTRPKDLTMYTVNPTDELKTISEGSTIKERIKELEKQEKEELEFEENLKTEFNDMLQEKLSPDTYVADNAYLVVDQNNQEPLMSNASIYETDKVSNGTDDVIQDNSEHENRSIKKQSELNGQGEAASDTSLHFTGDSPDSTFKCDKKVAEGDPKEEAEGKKVAKGDLKEEEAAGKKDEKDDLGRQETDKQGLESVNNIKKKEKDGIIKLEMENQGVESSNSIKEKEKDNIIKQEMENQGVESIKGTEEEENEYTVKQKTDKQGIESTNNSKDQQEVQLVNKTKGERTNESLILPLVDSTNYNSEECQNEKNENKFTHMTMSDDCKQPSYIDQLKLSPTGNEDDVESLYKSPLNSITDCGNSITNSYNNSSTNTSLKTNDSTTPSKQRHFNDNILLINDNNSLSVVSKDTTDVNTGDNFFVNNKKIITYNTLSRTSTSSTSVPIATKVSLYSVSPSKH